MVDNGTGKPPQKFAPQGLSSLGSPAADGGLSLDELNQAFAQLLGSGLDPYDAAAAADALDEPEVDESGQPAAVDADAACEITPRSILEAMLFVGHPSNEPLSAEQVAGLMRGVRPSEIDDLVCDLNSEYERNRCPYTIASEGAGYRLVLREEFHGVRDKFYGRARASHLSPAAMEVLALLAYRGPMTDAELCRLRGAASGQIVGQLVRRQLLQVERDAEARVTRYRVSQRFLELFKLERLEDLPRSQDVDQQ
jgi:segregation and condensation protein B